MTTIGRYSTASDILDFWIDDHQCFAAGKLAADDFVEFVGILGQLGSKGDDGKVAADGLGETIGLLADAVKLCCDDATVEFITVGMRSKTNPIDLDILQSILSDLLAAYGMAGDKDENGDEVADQEVAPGDRPTQRTSDSETGSASTNGGSAGG